VAPEILSLFAPNVALADDGHLTVAGVRAEAVAAEFGTPAYVVDEDHLRDRARRFEGAMKQGWGAGGRASFASKAFPCTAVYRVMAEEGLGVDVAGAGELLMALAGGVDPRLIIVHGNAKTDDELRRALDAGVGCIVVDNEDDIDRLERMVGGEQGVLVRVIPGISADTHEAILTGQSGSKFGLELPDARRAIDRLRGSDKLRLDGVHVHVGSQILAGEPFAQAVEFVAGLGEFDVYNVGGGLGSRYTYADRPPSIEEYVQIITDGARKLLPESAQLIIEPGRSMVAETAFTLYRVVTVKHGTEGAPTFVAVDGGMGDNLEVSLFQQRFEATMVDRVGGGQHVTLVGRHCESGDTLIKDIELAEPVVGDLLAVPVTGAYCHTMANNYNGALKPPVVFVSQGRARAVLRRETYDDLLGRDLPA
jgi:diaminopimelate decarboxylase